MKKKFNLLKLIPAVFLIVVIVVTLFPVIYIFLSSFKEAKEIMMGGTKILPSKFTFENYITAWNAGNFSLYTTNSIIYSVSVSVITVVFCSMLAFSITRQDFAGKKFVVACYYGSMFVAGAVTIYPIFKMLVAFKLNKSLLGLILATVGMGQSFALLMIINYLKGIPKELDESAKLDGCSPFRLYREIILPIISPVISVVAIITFQSTWNNYMLPLALTISTPKLRPLSVGVTALAYAADGKVSGQTDLLIAGSCMAIIPIVIVYIVANKYFVSDILSGAVKG